MSLSEYKPVRADLINKMIMPHSRFPADIKFLWYDNAKNIGEFFSENAKPHSHPFFEVIFVVDGKVTYKLKEAKKLLLDENQSIKEIVFSLGFESESSFSSFFKRHAGLSAGAFKKHCTLCRDNGSK